MSIENSSAVNAQTKTKGIQKGIMTESKNLYGIYIRPNITPEDLVVLCDKHLVDCNRWIVNVTALKAETETKLKAQRVEAIKTSVSTMTAEEKAEIINLLSA